MKITRILILFICAVALSSFSHSPISLGKLEQGFQALEIFDYFKAKDLFYKSLKKHEAPASYGLSVIYGSDNNPFFNLDSAYKFIYAADSLYQSLSADQLETYSSIGASSEACSQWLRKIDSTFYEIALSNSSVDTWNNYLGKHKTEELNELARVQLHMEAFTAAAKTSTSKAYESFIQTYPDADEVDQASDSLDLLVYKEATASGLIVDYQQFIKQHPKNPYRRKAEQVVYQRFTEDDNLESYKRFIKENSENFYVSAAWRKIYALEIVELNAESIAAFSLKYPDYPYLDDLQAEYDLVATKFLAVYNGEKWGFIDEYGDLKIEHKFDFVEPFTESIALVGLNDSITYINKSGRYISDVLFEDGFSFKRGFAIVMLNDQYGAINRLGEWIIEPIFSDVGEFSGGFFYLDNGDAFGYANQDGDVVIDFQFTDANDFHNGASVVEKNGKYGLINSLGEPISAFKYDRLDGFSQWPCPSRYKIGELQGIISLDGSEITSPAYEQIGEFKEGKALFASDGKYGFIGIYGDTLIKPSYTYSTKAFQESFFDKGYAKVFQDSKVAIIDSSGKKFYPAIFENVGGYDSTRIAIKKRGLWGYADKNVDLVIPYKYEQAGDFVDSVALVKEDGMYHLIDTLGNNVLDTSYSNLNILGSMLVAGDSLLGVMSRDGEIMAPFEYEEIELVHTWFLRLKYPNGRIEYFDQRSMKFIWREEDTKEL